MKLNYFKKITVVVIAAFVSFAFCGCSLFGGSGTNDNKPAVYISQSEITLSVGDTVLLDAVSTDGSAVTWDSSDSAVATVSSGLVTGVSKGEAVIMASTQTVMAVCTIKVNEKSSVTPPIGDTPDAETLVLSLANLSLEVGGSVTLTATSSLEGVQIIWDSSNKTVATVSNGKVTAKAVGKTTITANSGTAIASCEITVTENIPVGSQKPGYTLVWNDEFTGSSLDTSKWCYQEGTRDIYHGFDTQVWEWGNGELQYYTQDAVSVSNGSLVITARKQAMSSDIYGSKDYTSGRILTRDKASWTYGYFEAKIKTPTGNGMWPAFWMLPQPSSYANVSNKYGGWPDNGEIDIMEAKGRLYNKVDCTLHFAPESREPDAWYSEYRTVETTLSSNTDQWHTYAVEWTAKYIAWIVDGNEVLRVSSSIWREPRYASATSESAPFDQPFYILLNLAVGGGYDGGVAPDAASFSSASMYVDYVRVYEKA